MTTFVFEVGTDDPCEVYILIDSIKRVYETPEIARAVVDGQNSTPGRNL
jgi:hypothetical protein